MAKKIIKRYLPDPSKIKNAKSLRWMGNLIHDPNLWHLNRRSVSLAFFVGLFFAFLPLPIQMPIAAAVSLMVKSNLPISVTLVWITNPITIPPMFYFSYRVGANILQIPPTEFEIQLTWEWFSQGFAAIWEPLFLGSFICGLIAGSIGYITMRLYWRWHVVSNWSKRRECRKKKRQ